MILYKFNDTIAIGVGTQIPFTVIPLTGRVADPFASTTDVFAIEFEVTSFSGFLLQPTFDALPLSLVSFEAKAVNNETIALHWSVEDAHEALYYELEKSIDGVNFRPFATIEATAAKNYEQEDLDPYTGQSYYRLKMVDIDQQVAYSPIQVVTIEVANSFEVYPNPTSTSNITLQVTNAGQTKIRVTVFNSIGQQVQRKNFELVRGEDQLLTIDLPNLPTGGYILEIASPEGALLEKKWFIKR